MLVTGLYDHFSRGKCKVCQEFWDATKDYLKNMEDLYGVENNCLVLKRREQAPTEPLLLERETFPSFAFEQFLNPDWQPESAAMPVLAVEPVEAPDDDQQAPPVEAPGPHGGVDNYNEDEDDNDDREEIPV